MEKKEIKVRIKKIELENFRLFPFFEMEFDEGLLVLIGGNGSGKSTITDATALLLQAFLKDQILYKEQPLERNKNLPEINLTPSDIHYGTKISNGKLFLDLTIFGANGTYENISEESDAQKGEDLEIRFKRKDEEGIQEIREDASSSWLNERGGKPEDGRGYKIQLEAVIGFKINKEKGRATYNFEQKRVQVQGNEFDFRRFFESEYIEEIDNLPVFIYYGCNQLEVEPVKSIERQSHQKKENRVYDRALTPERFSFQQFYEWFDRETKLTIDLNKRIINEDKRPHLAKIREAILDMLNDGDDAQKQYSNLRMDFGETGNAILIDKKIGRDAIPIELSQLSAGEKNLVALTADIGRRLIAANPNEEDPLKDGYGIVIIDEIDLHLHPNWQLKVIPRLRKIFENIQFFITTHSALAIGRIESKNILKLSNQTVGRIDATYGRDPNYILGVVFGLENEIQALSEQIEEIDELIAFDDLEEADKKLKELMALIEKGEEHPDLSALRTLIIRKKTIGR